MGTLTAEGQSTAGIKPAMTEIAKPTYKIGDYVVYNLDDDDSMEMLLKIEGYINRGEHVGKTVFSSPELNDGEYILGFNSEILRHATDDEIRLKTRILLSE